MQLDSIAGNTGVVQSLKTALRSGRLAHGVLLTAPDGCGRGFAARCLAADYLYPEGTPFAVDAVMRLESPEVLVVAGEGKSGQIPVDRIRAVRRDIFHSALSAGGRVVWIRDAHRMAAPAYNALLKVLEEPPEGALFLLTAHDAAALPATITSRCTLYPLAPVSVEECAAVLANAAADGPDPALPTLLAVLYGGRIGAGMAVLAGEDRQAILKDGLRAAAAAAKGDSYTLLRLFSAYEGRADGDRERREALLGDLSEVLAARLRGAKARGIPDIPPGVAARMLPAVQQARLALRGNTAPKLTFAALAVRLAPPPGLQNLPAAE